MTFSDYDIFTLYRNAGTPVVGPAVTPWLWPGAAATASTLRLFPDAQQNKSVVYARWVLPWNPNAIAGQTGVRLMYFDATYALHELAKIERNGVNSPFADGVEVTSTFSAMWEAYKTSGSFLHIGHQTYGNGTTGPLIYGSWVEIGWA